MKPYDFESPLENLQKALGSLDEGFIEVLKKKYISLDSSIWRKICDKVSETVKYRPKIANFVEAYRALLSSGIERDKRSLCDGCNGKTLVPGYFKTEFDGKIFSASKPCPQCRPNSPRCRFDWIEIPYDQYMSSIAPYLPAEDPLLAESARRSIAERKFNGENVDEAVVNFCKKTWENEEFAACVDAAMAIKIERQLREAKLLRFRKKVSNAAKVIQNLYSPMGNKK